MLVLMFNVIPHVCNIINPRNCKIRINNIKSWQPEVNVPSLISEEQQNFINLTS